MQDGRLCSCSDDNTIKIYNLKTNTIDIEISKLHNYSVQNLSQLDNGILLSCDDWDSTIKLWEISKETYKLLTTLYGHKNTVNKVIPLSKNRIASCSWDCKIIIWETIPPYKKITTLKGHKDIVNTIIALTNKEMLVSGSSDQTLFFWNLEDYQERKRIPDIPCYSFCELPNNRLAVGGYKSITVVNFLSYQIEAIIEDEGFGYCRSFIILKNGNLLCGCGDGFEGYLCELNLINYALLYKKEKAHKKCVTSLVKINDNSFATCCQDCFIKVLEM